MDYAPQDWHHSGGECCWPLSTGEKIWNKRRSETRANFLRRFARVVSVSISPHECAAGLTWHRLAMRLVQSYSMFILSLLFSIRHSVC